jgi:predicted nucleic acid-binding protein
VIVVDASVGVAATYAPDGFAQFGEEQLVAPALFWSETRSALHVLLWRGEITRQDAETARARLESAPVERRDDPVGDDAWRIAEAFGWAKTYDAEYVALAELLGCRLVTVDGRLRRRCEGLGFVIGPTEL